MWPFKKQPPPPKKSVPGWVQLATPIIFAIFLGMITFIGNGFSEDIKEIKSQVKEVDERKVDNQTLQLMIKNQAILIQQQKEEAEHKRQEDSKKFEQLQQTQSETLKQLQMIQIQRAYTPIEPEIVSKGSSSISTKEALTPEEFDKYINLKPEVQVKYKRYLEKIGKDVSGLP